MRVEKPRVRLIVEAACNEIKSAGVEPTVSDILWLAHLADNQCSPSKTDPMDDFGVPVRCGRASFRPLTIAGDVWLNECAYNWWGDTWLSRIAEIYALAHSHDADTMRQGCMWDRRKARGVVLRWAVSSLPVSAGKIQRAIDLVHGRIDQVDIEDPGIVKDKPDQADAHDWGEEIAMLCAAYKQPPEYFAFELSINQVMGLIRKAAFAFGRPDLAAAPDKDSAFGKFRLAVKDIIRKGQENGS